MSTFNSFYTYTARPFTADLVHNNYVFHQQQYIL